jgi:hypothetical protein
MRSSASIPYQPKRQEGSNDERPAPSKHLRQRSKKQRSDTKAEDEEGDRLEQHIESRPKAVV